MHAIAFTTGEVTDDFLLIGTAKIKAPNIGARWYLVFTDRNDVLAIGDFLPDGFLRVECVATLINISELHGFPDTQFTAVRFFLTDNHTE